ncbi:MAG: hypothetical protein Q8N00_04065 [Nitrospirota bacterium]|nr:hypothetical protein [Nitrospirota bacterium]MDP3596390.1 hypothetical protein [Nitrospirota bacterium]
MWLPRFLRTIASAHCAAWLQSGRPQGRWGRTQVPVTYVVLNQGSLVLELWTGVVAHEEVLTHERQHVSDASIARGVFVLVDATGASFETTTESVHEVTDLYRRSIEKLRVGKAALLVNEATYDRARIYEKQSRDHGLRVILFNSLDVASAWVGVDVTRAREAFEQLRSCIPGVGAVTPPT